MDSRGICTSCGNIFTGAHDCSDDIARLAEIDRLAGPRNVREALIAINQKGFNNKVEALENEAITIRARLVK